MTSTATRPDVIGAGRSAHARTRAARAVLLPPPEPLGPQVLALPLHLAVLHPVRDRRDSSRSSTRRSSRSRSGTSSATPARSSASTSTSGSCRRPTSGSPCATRSASSCCRRSRSSSLALFIAAMLDRNIRAKTFWRMSVLLPYVMAPVAVALIFSNMFGDNHGLVNNILTNIGLRPIAVAQGPVLEPHRHRDDGQLPLDRLQRPDPARRDAGGAARLLRGRHRRRRQRVPPVLRASRSRRSSRRSSS